MRKVFSISKHLINCALRTVGHRIDRIDLDGVVFSIERLALHLERFGILPQTVFDIGVATGTPNLYNAFPKAKYFLVDPTPQSLPFMQSLSQRLNAEILNIAFGNFDGTIKVKVPQEHWGATIFEEVGPVELVAEVEVPVRRFDGVIKSFARPALMKVDVQGAELMVLEGVGSRIKEIDCLIIETSLIATLKGGPEFVQILALMKALGFVLFDFTGGMRRPLDQALAQVDAVFVTEESPLRRDRRWSI